MNTKSEDVVKNVESNNVESTSNEQRQTNKPIVISRRRLLRAGVAGIPVVLTMAGIAPAAGIQTVSSAASGLMYGGNKVRGRFEGTSGAVSDNLVWSNHNGFVLKNGTDIYTSDPPLHFGAVSGSKNQGTVQFTNSTLTSDNTASRSDVTIAVNNSANLNFECPAYLHKSGAWYTDLLNGSKVFLSDFIKNNIDWKNTLSVTSSGSGSAVTIKNVEPAADSGTSPAVSFDNGSDWVETAGYQDDSTSLKNFYLCPDSSSGTFKINFKCVVTLECTEERTVGGVTTNYPFTATTTVELPLTITVSNIPGRINYDGTI